MRVKQWISLFLCVIILLPGCAASEEKKTEREIFAMDTYPVLGCAVSTVLKNEFQYGRT